MEEIMTKRNYKDSVFRVLFKGKKELLSLYNALYKTDYRNPDELDVVTLENAIYMKQKNDLACILDLRMSVIEHQSSINPNMPLRDLKYIVDLFDKITKEQDIYSRKLILLPCPSFVVLYNGAEPQPEYSEMRLSDAYMGKVDKINLELIVSQYNINDGFNEKLKKDCPTLMGYSYFVNLVRKYLEQMELTEAVDIAVDECIENDILKEFFMNNRREVESMSLYDFNEELHNRTLYEEGVEDGIEKNQQTIISRMLDKGTSVEMIHELTDIPTATIYSIQENRMNPSVVCEPDSVYVAGNN